MKNQDSGLLVGQ